MCVYVRLVCSQDVYLEPVICCFFFFFYQAVLSLLSTRWPYFFDISHYVAAFSPQEIYDEIPPFFFFFGNDSCYKNLMVLNEAELFILLL